MMSQIEWKNTPDLYNDYCYLEECSKAMALILKAYQWFFDDNFFYWLVKPRKTSRNVQIVKRRPLYWYPQKSTPSEKVRF
jgi:hypothetical protein